LELSQYKLDFNLKKYFTRRRIPLALPFCRANLFKKPWPKAPDLIARYFGILPSGARPISLH
jgi:hypothetical protein